MMSKRMFVISLVLIGLLLLAFTSIVNASLEDFTAPNYTEVDEDGDITVTSTKCAVDTMRYDAVSHVYKDYGAGHFTDFNHTLKVTCPVLADGVFHYPWAVSNIYLTGADCWANSDGISVALAESDPETMLYLQIFETQEIPDCYNFPAGAQTFWLAVNRTGSAVNVYIYSDEAMTTILDVLSGTADTTAYRYVFPVMGQGAGAGAYACTWDTENLDLHEAVPPPPPPPINITTTLPYPNYAWLSVSGVRAVGIRPADIKLNDNDFIVAEFSDNAEEYIQANLMIPIDANRSSNISICIGWSSPVVNKTCDWEITYLITGRNENTDQVGTMIQTYNNSSAVPNGLVTHHVLTLTPDNFSDVDVCIHIQVMRDGNDENDNIDNIVEIHGIAIGYTANVTGFTESEADELFLSSAFSLTTESLVLLIWMFFIILGEWKTDWVYKILQLPIGLTYGVTLLDANMYLGLGVIFASIYILAVAFWQSRKEKND